MEKINISIQLGTSPPEKKPEQKAAAPTLEQKIEHAICCIECKTPDRWQAIEFLQKVFAYLDKLEHRKKSDTLLLERIKPVIDEYGYFPEGT